MDRDFLSVGIWLSDEPAPNQQTAECGYPLKKTTNSDKGNCDKVRLRAFREQLGYQYGALIVCETRAGREPATTIADWVSE